VIEGAWRYLVKERIETTGARWSLKDAEAALRASADFDAYWAFYIAREHARSHSLRYVDGAMPSPFPASSPCSGP
jgi:hypothetical protein